ncbi:MAG: hypothetical protein JJ863_31210 [Deltaproteobacteria bacterium]|nr:hypothetical protein [Deltaproteobacteria bacterium]
MSSRIALQLSRLDGGLPPEDPSAWDAADDVASMIEVLRHAGRLGLMTLDPIETEEREGRVTRWRFRARRHDGVWVRVDVGPDEPARLREAVPELPSAAQWEEAIERHVDALDPLARLLFEVRRDGAPSPAWEERWGPARQGLEAAWAASEDPMAMRAMLSAMGVGALDLERPRPTGGLLASSSRTELADAIRRAMPTLPNGGPMVALPPAEQELLGTILDELLPHRFGDGLVDRGSGAFTGGWLGGVHIELVFAFVDPVTELPLSVVAETCWVTRRREPKTRAFLEGWRDSLAHQASMRGWFAGTAPSSALAPRMGLLGRPELKSAADFAAALCSWES